ncbi:MAG TPA: group II intron reverse transcriptase/maturase [Candidatus Sulfotelmatobacter sp.]|nr:group II intron reverse transcriptase/maturase [Candidatus Sulfotelmatobacter sp.]
MTPAVQPDSRTAGEGLGRTARTDVPEESHDGIVPMNHSNKDERPLAENEEGRPSIKENAGQPHTYPTQSGKGVSQGLAGVRKAARENKEMKFTALLHHLTVDLLRESFYSLKKKAAPGVDGVTWQEYETGIEDRLIDLHGRVHRGAYRAQPSRRVYIEKADGRQRPLGVAALEDKLVQYAVATILNQIYEEDFLGFSYGFRPGRSQHDALDALSYALLKTKVNYILDADVRSFFDNLDKSWMIRFIEHRVADPRILRLIQKWLKAGVMEEGKWSEPKTGTPQGSVISPLLANVYLHYAFDLWVDVWRKKWAQGEVVVVRYADDIILGFQYRTDADRFLENLRERLAMFGLELHPDKTRRIEFGRFAEENRKRRGEGKPETFDFLGFTHISGKNSLGRFTVRRKTIRKRMRAKLQQLKQELQRRMHDPIAQTGRWLQSVVQGYFNYYAVPGNLDSLAVFRQRLLGLWWRRLRRRSQKHPFSWTRTLVLGDRWLPQPRVLHPYPADRFAASHPR